MSKEKKKTVIVNIVVMGECTVGKSTLIERLEGKKFDDNIMHTETDQSEQFDIQEDNITYRIVLYDVQPTNFGNDGSLTRVCSKGPIHLFVFSPDVVDSFHFIEGILSLDVYKNLPHITNRIIIMNKKDAFDKDQMNKSELYNHFEEFCNKKENGINYHCVVSCKDDGQDEMEHVLMDIIARVTKSNHMEHRNSKSSHCVLE